jgi:hypothetical protein
MHTIPTLLRIRFPGISKSFEYEFSSGRMRLGIIFAYRQGS